ncbi:MAG: hypothetical protein ACK50A_10365 [Sphingobacteriaceae bacterium]
MTFIYNKLSKVILIGIITVVNIACAQKKVMTDVKYFQPYCGGARPTPEMELDAQTPKPYASKIIYFVSAKGKVDSAKTNEIGVFYIKLKPGVYKCYEAWRYKKQTPDQSASDRFESDCLKKEWDKEFMILTVSKVKFTKQNTNQIINQCDYNLPCLKETSKPPMRE